MSLHVYNSVVCTHCEPRTFKRRHDRLSYRYKILGVVKIRVLVDNDTSQLFLYGEAELTVNQWEMGKEIPAKLNRYL